MRMAITIATIGRLMKNFDMLLGLSLRRIGRNYVKFVLLRGDLFSVSYFRAPFRDHAIPRLQAALNHPHLPDFVADLNRPNINFVVRLRPARFDIALAIRTTARCGTTSAFC